MSDKQNSKQTELTHLAGALRKTYGKGFYVADFATLSDERSSHSKIFLLFNKDKRTLH